MRRNSADRLVAKIFFVTGTDTGVGKTVVTASLLYALRKRGTRALAMKPFCSGRRTDVRLLQSVQQREITDQEANPFYFPLPLAPLLAARKMKRNISPAEVLERIAHVARKCDFLLVEGAGGLLAPLGDNFSAVDLIRNLQCDVCVVGANKLGVLNLTLLTIAALQPVPAAKIKVVLSQTKRSQELSSKSNVPLLAELLAPLPVSSLPHLGPRASSYSAVRRNHPRIKSLAAALLDFNASQKKAPGDKPPGA